MKSHAILTAMCLVLLLKTSVAQEQGTQLPNYIKSGFYMRLGPVIPVGLYAEGQELLEYSGGVPDTVVFPPAKMGGGFDLGFLIYFGPSFANKKIRAGMDATFVSLSFNASKYTVMTTDEDDKHKYWYYYAGQKFGPLITINPVDRLMIDLSFKLHAYISWHHDDWGTNMFQKEASLCIRYRVMQVSFLYNFGEVNYDDLAESKPDRYVNNNTIRIMFGLKF